MVRKTLYDVLGNSSGQATLEYALVMSALLASIIAFGAVLGFVRSPAAFDTALQSSAHTAYGGDVYGGIWDAAVF